MMGIQLSWFDETKTAIFYTFPAHWTIAQYEQQVTKAREMAEPMPNKSVHVVGDMRKTLMISPSNLSSLLNTFRDSIPSFSQKAIVISLPETSKRIYRILRDRMFGDLNPNLEIKFVETMEEARAEIQRLNEATGVDCHSTSRTK